MKLTKSGLELRIVIEKEKMMAKPHLKPNKEVKCRSIDIRT
jgi:hypothetical protein